jgi:hypothetical protein
MIEGRASALEKSSPPSAMESVTGLPTDHQPGTYRKIEALTGVRLP